MFSYSAIPGVHVLQVFAGDVCEVVDGVDWGWWVVGHVVAREEAGDVEGDVGVDCGEPFCFGLHFCWAVVAARDDEGGDFKVAVFCGDGDVALDGGEVAAEGAVPAVVKAFEIDVCGIDEGEKFAPGFFFDGAVADEDVEQAGLANTFGTVAHVFIANERFVVGVSDTNVAVWYELSGEVGEFLWRHIARGCFAANLSDGCVLAEGTAEVAAEAADGEDLASGMEASQRFLFDGIEGERGEVAVVQRDDLVAPTRAGAAEAGLAFIELAMVKAEGAGLAHR